MLRFSFLLIFSVLFPRFSLNSPVKGGDREYGNELRSSIEFSICIAQLEERPSKLSSSRMEEVLSECWEDFEPTEQSCISSDIIEGSDRCDAPQSNFPIHVVGESKSFREFMKLQKTKMKSRLGFSSDDDSHDQHTDYFFPRLTPFKNLPELTAEPYQRVMSFAIEVCMIPYLWYLELVHCMYMGTAPYFEGVLMSYSLQDLVGSAINTIGYSDEGFSLENCYNSVSMVADNHISPNYIEICTKMSQCLESKPFQSGSFSHLASEFETRIENTYKVFTQFGDKDYRKLGRFFLRSSLFIFTSKMRELTVNHPERNFLVIRSMISNFALYLLQKERFSSQNSGQEMTMLFLIFMRGLTKKKEDFLNKCSNYLGIILELKKRHVSFERALCKEFISIGFIKDDVTSFGDEDAFAKSLLPARILSKSYGALVPSMVDSKDISDLDRRWISAIIEHEGTTTPALKVSPTGFYISKRLMKTKKNASTEHLRETRRTRKKRRVTTTGRITRTWFRLTATENSFKIRDIFLDSNRDN
ncbi:putative Secreted Protein (WYLE family) [Cryptosporidium felis]|nr:putative Secreted Protein (WYLE family) [Cryptosporidium felis]